MHRTLLSLLHLLQQNILFPYEFPYKTRNKTETQQNLYKMWHYITKLALQSSVELKKDTWKKLFMYGTERVEE